MEDYLRNRDTLIQQDRAFRPDHATSAGVSDNERKADKILRNLRSTEAKTIWGQERRVKHPHLSKHMFPGMEFLTARDAIESTKVFDILTKMPKGALLHAHLDAMVDAKVLLRLALQQPAMHIRIPSSLSLENFKAVSPEFRALPKAQWTQTAGVSDPLYAANSWVSIQNARHNFSAALGGPEGFDRWIIDSLMIDPAEAYGTYNETNKIWERFEHTFVVSDGLFRYVPIYTEYLREFFLSSIADGISYVEPRILFWFKYFVGEDGEENVPHRVWIEIYERVLNEVKSSLAAQGRADEFIGSKIIYSTLRDITPEELEWYTEDCLALKKEFPHLIAGFDLVGHEDSLKPLIYYAEPLLRFVERQKEEDVFVPFIFHAGETLGDGTHADMNVYDAILLGTKRIGHGFSITKHPKLIEICREKEICLEMCPISNEVLRFTGSMPMHPLPSILAQGVHVALCSDDPAAFGNMGLSYDFFQVFVTSEINGLVTLRELVRDSIRYASLDEEERLSALAALERRWVKFVKYIIETYGVNDSI